MSTRFRQSRGAGTTSVIRLHFCVQAGNVFLNSVSLWSLSHGNRERKSLADWFLSPQMFVWLVSIFTTRTKTDFEVTHCWWARRVWESTTPLLSLLTFSASLSSSSLCFFFKTSITAKQTWHNFYMIFWWQSKTVRNEMKSKKDRMSREKFDVNWRERVFKECLYYQHIR